MKLNNIAGFESFAFLHLPPTDKMREAFEFYTDIVTSQDGSESRSVGRTIARHTLSYSVDANLFNRQFPFNLGEQNIRGDWAVPVWSDVQTLTPLDATVTLPVDPYLSDFRAGSLVMAFVNNDDWQIRKIAPAIPTGSLTITGGTITFGLWDLPSASYSSVNFSVSGQITSLPVGVAFSSNGLKMYVANSANSILYQYTLSTAWNIGSASYNGASFNFSSQSSAICHFAFSQDGTKLYIYGLNPNRVYQYALSTAWDIGSASYTGTSINVIGQYAAGALAFSVDGTQMYVGDNGDKKVRQYTLSTAWNIGSASYNSFFDTTGQDFNSPLAIYFSPDGTQMYLLGAATYRVYQYTLGTPWLVSTASYSGYSFNIETQDNFATGLAFKPDGSRMYMVGLNSRSVYQYNVGGVLNAIDNLTIGGVVVIGSPIPHTGNNESTATKVADTINSFISNPDYSATSAGSVVTILGVSEGAGGPINVTTSGNLTVGSIVNVAGGNGVGANSITLESPFDARPYAYIVPVNTAKLRGDIDFNVGSFSSDFSFDVNIINPKPYSTKLGILFACNVSSSMAGAKLISLKADLTRVLQDLRGAVVNSGVDVDLCLCLWGSSESTLTYPNANAANFDTAIAAVAAIGSLGGTVPLLAFERAVTFFGASSPNPNDRKDIMFFSTDTTTSLTSSRAAALDLISRLSPYDGRRSVDIYAIGINLNSFTEFNKVDNASKDVYSNVDSVTPFAMSDRFLSVLSPIIGYQFDGYEIVTNHPNSNNKFSRTITQREDIFDTDLAPYVTRTPWTQSRVKSNHPFLFEGGGQSVAIRQFLYRRQGAARLFYMPTFQHDLPAYAISGDLTQISVPNLDIRSFDANRVNVAIEFSDGTWQGNRITSISADLFGGWVITFARALRKGLAEVRQISYMGLSRFETDRIEMQWVGNRAVSMSINMLEIDK